MSDGISPFKRISELFILNQNSFNQDVQQLRTSLRSLYGVLDSLIIELEKDPFKSDLNVLKGIDVFALQILDQGKSLEQSREKILESIKILEKSNDKKLS
jgi:hypothetical protein